MCNILEKFLETTYSLTSIGRDKAVSVHTRDFFCSCFYDQEILLLIYNLTVTCLSPPKTPTTFPLYSDKKQDTYLNQRPLS